jgi:transcriptional regulator with XRE-family HTH domain
MAVKTKRKIRKHAKFSDVQNLNFRKAKVGQLIRFHRLRQGLTMEAVADSIGNSKGYLSGIELGRVKPSLEHLQEIADTLKVNIYDLLR